MRQPCRCNYYAPELANRFFDTLTIQKGLPKILIDFSLAAFQIIVGLIVLSLYHPFFIIFGVLLIAIIYIILIISGPKGIKTSLEESTYKYKVAYWLEEIARTKLSFKLVHGPNISLSKTDENVSNYLESRESHFRVLIIQFLNLIGFKVLIAAGLLIIGSILVFEQQMNIGQFVAAEIIIILIISSVEKLIKSLDSIYDVLTALEKIGYITDMDLDNDADLVVSSDDGIKIEVHNLKFCYPDSGRVIIENLSFEMEKDESIVLMGSAGAGKSTLLSLLAGISEPQEGVIMYNGLSLNSMNFNDLRKDIGFALSNNQIFYGTLLENITMGRDYASTDDVVAAIEMVNLQSFIDTLQNGLNTNLDPEGIRIPRSAANKVILARAICSNPKLLILEDPLDHVPKVEKELIIQRLTNTINPWNILIVAVDPTWSKYVSRKIIMDQGKIVNDTSN